MKITGKPVDFKEVEAFGLEESAKLFSEGNKDLEELLLTLWDMGIQTNTCCKGASEKDHRPGELLKFPYIALRVTEKSLNTILPLTEIILHDKSLNRCNVEFSLSREVGSKDNKRVCVLTYTLPCLTNSQCEQFFKRLLKIAKKVQQCDIAFDATKNHPAFNLIGDLANMAIDTRYFSHIGIKLHQNKKSVFSYGKVGCKPTFKTKITDDNVDKIKDLYSPFTYEYRDPNTINEL